MTDLDRIGFPPFRRSFFVHRNNCRASSVRCHCPGVNAHLGGSAIVTKVSPLRWWPLPLSTIRPKRTGCSDLFGLKTTMMTTKCPCATFEAAAEAARQYFHPPSSSTWRKVPYWFGGSGANCLPKKDPVRCVHKYRGAFLPAQLCPCTFDDPVISC